MVDYVACALNPPSIGENWLNTLVQRFSDYFWLDNLKINHVAWLALAR